MVLNMGPLDWESSILTTRQLSVDDTIFSIYTGLTEYIISVLNSFHKKIQFNHEVESNGKKESSSDVYLHCDSFMPISWKRGILTTLVDRAYLICSTPRLLEKELTHITIIFRNTNGYPNCIINQVKVKQRDPVPNSHVSNENEATQHSDQTIVEEHDGKNYQGEKGEHIKEKKGNRLLSHLEKL